MDIRKQLDEYRPKVKVKAVDMTDEWGCVVFVRKLPLGDLLELKGEETPITKVVAACLCDADGKLIYQPEEHEQLHKFPLDELAKIERAATSHNTFNVDDAKKN